MKKRYVGFGILILLFGISCLSYAQTESEGLPNQMTFGAGVGFEYFNRTISWDDGELTSPLKTLMLTLNADIEIIDGLTLGAIVGYASSNMDALMFRELPISLELNSGSISGFALGAEAEFVFYRTYDFALSAIGQFLYYSGGTKEWDIPGLSVEGKAKGKPKWSRGIIGLSFEYTGMDYFFPYASLSYTPLWGSFEMDESIDGLTGTEKKDIKGKGKFAIGLGGLYEISDSIGLKAEIDILPYSGGVDLGILVRIRYEF
ncbi:hypothetical protein ACFLT2_02595 [Acidobacteriota bacterium]